MTLKLIEEFKMATIAGLICGMLIVGITACSTVQWQKTETDVAGWYTAANVLWNDLGQKKPKSQIKADLIAGGVSEATASQIISYLGISEVAIEVTKDVASNIDKIAAALDSSK